MKTTISETISKLQPPRFQGERCERTVIDVNGKEVVVEFQAEITRPLGVLVGYLEWKYLRCHLAPSCFGVTP